MAKNNGGLLMQSVIKKEETQKETIQQIKGVMYEEEKMQMVLNLLNTVQVNGIAQIKAMSNIFDVLSQPIPFKSVEEVTDTASPVITK
jgi:hypothetical protein